MKQLTDEIEKYSGKYQFSFQFWGEGDNNVYIMKDDVDLWSTGGLETIEDTYKAALSWVYRVNRVPKSKRVEL